MIEPILVAALPVLFMAVLAVGGASLRRGNIDMEGRPPIDQTVFLVSKLAMIVPWTSMVLQSFGVGLLRIRLPLALIFGAAIAAIHHRIILAEEECLKNMFGKDYEEYRGRIGRYL